MSFRHFKYIFPLALLLLGGCMKEDEADCPDTGPNFTLLFTFPDEHGTEQFDQHIDRVWVYLFNPQGGFVTAAYTDGQELKASRGVRLALEPGNYRVVCWGNLHDPDDDSRVSDLTSAHVVYTTQQSPVYYAPNNRNARSKGLTSEGTFMVSVPERKEVTETIEFMESSRPITITVIGFNDIAGEENLTPDLELTNLPLGNNFTLNLYPGKGSYLKSADRLPEVNKSRVVFHTPYFSLEEDMQLMLYRQSNGATVYGGGLKHILDEIGVEPAPDDPIELEIEFLEGYIKITVPGYREGPVIPNI